MDKAKKFHLQTVYLFVTCISIMDKTYRQLYYNH